MDDSNGQAHLPISPDAAGRDVDLLRQLIGQTVVLDTATSVVYLGTLVDVRPDMLTLENADVHDCNDGYSGKDQYVHESKGLGVRANRAVLHVARRVVMSVSRLDDVIIT